MNEIDLLDPEKCPKQIGPYVIEAPLDKGGMSYVYLGYDPGSADKKKVIIKILDPKYATHKRRLESFLNEAKILNTLDHPNIPKIYRVDKWEHGLYIAMEYLHGIPLTGFLRSASFSLEKALDILLQISYALYHLHSHGVVHRDLKPGNIIITKSTEIKVIDFSISQILPEGEETNLLDSDVRAGTAMYMSPEQLEHPGLVTKATDIYALGIIAYELILGRHTHGVIQTFLLPMGLRQIVEKTLQINPALRYEDVAQFINEIRDYKKRLEEGRIEKELPESGPVKELIDHIRSILIPKKGPKSAQFEIGITSQEGLLINGLYLDFFDMKESKQALIMAEPLKQGVNSLFHIFGLRSMIRFDAIQKEGLSNKTLETISKALYNDPIDQKFGACSLVLDPKNNCFHYTNCGFAELWHIKEELEVVQNKNKVLGEYSKWGFQEIEKEWEKGSLLILYSHPMDLKKKKDRIPLILALKDLPIEELAKKMIQRLTLLSPSAIQQGATLIAIRKLH